ncbi:MAG: hypothetical protein IPL65_02870 [Lewinellaceae bacterium]|nr:hypothetical protein [Lewinellaceae bacterium]
MMVSIAWGKNFFLNDVLYDYLPMFNKFRAVSMALGPAQWCLAALAAIGLKMTDTAKYPLTAVKSALHCFRPDRIAGVGGLDDGRWQRSK